MENSLHWIFDWEKALESAWKENKGVLLQFHRDECAGCKKMYAQTYMDEDFRVLMRLGKAALDMPRGKYLQIIDLMDDGLVLFPNNPKAASLLFTRGMAEYLLGKEKSSFRGTMKEIVEQYPENQEARMWPWMDQP